MLVYTIVYFLTKLQIICIQNRYALVCFFDLLKQFIEEFKAYQDIVRMIDAFGEELFDR